jgi:hypothetical protein
MPDSAKEPWDWHISSALGPAKGGRKAEVAYHEIVPQRSNRPKSRLSKGRSDTPGRDVLL